MATAASLSPSLFSMLIEQAAQGAVKPSALMNNVQANTEYKVGDVSAKFVKVGPGHFNVTVTNGDGVAHDERAITAIESKLMVLDALIDSRKQAKRQAS